MSATSSLVSPACKTAAPGRTMFPQDLARLSSPPLTSLSHHQPDNRPLASRFCHPTIRGIARCQHLPHVHPSLQPHDARGIQHPPQLQPTASVPLYQGRTAAPGTYRHTRSHRHMQRCRVCRVCRVHLEQKTLSGQVSAPSSSAIRRFFPCPVLHFFLYTRSLACLICFSG